MIEEKTVTRRACGKIVTWLRSAILGSALACGLSDYAGADADPKIRIAFPSGMNGRLIVVMDRGQIAKKNGLEAEFTAFQNGPPMMEALVSGSVDAVVTSLMPVATYAAKVPGDVKIVAMLGQSTYALVTAKDSAVYCDADLKGRTIGVSFGSDSHLDALIWLKESGLGTDAKLVNIGPSELASALDNRSVDAVIIRQPQVRRLQELSGARVIRSWPHRFLSIVKASFIKSNPQAYARYIKALRDSAQFVDADPKTTARWFGEHLKIGPALVEQVTADDAAVPGAGSTIEEPVAEPSRTAIRRWLKEAYDNKMIRTAVDDTLLLP